MKCLMIFFMLTMMVQPVPVEACDMENDHGTAHHVVTLEETSPDCCDSGDDETAHSCNSVLACSACPSGINMAPVNTGQAPSALVHVFAMSSNDRLEAAHSRPLYRPPIS